MAKSFEDRLDNSEESIECTLHHSCNVESQFKFSPETIQKLRKTARPQEEISKYPDSYSSDKVVEIVTTEDE